MDAGDLLGKAHGDGFGLRGVGCAGIEPWLRDHAFNVVDVVGPLFEISRPEVGADDVAAGEERRYLSGQNTSSIGCGKTSMIGGSRP